MPPAADHAPKSRDRWREWCGAGYAKVTKRRLGATSKTSSGRKARDAHCARGFFAPGFGLMAPWLLASLLLALGSWLLGSWLLCSWLWALGLWPGAHGSLAPGFFAPGPDALGSLLVAACRMLQVAKSQKAKRPRAEKQKAQSQEPKANSPKAKGKKPGAKKPKAKSQQQAARSPKQNAQSHRHPPYPLRAPDRSRTCDLRFRNSVTSSATIVFHRQLSPGRRPVPMLADSRNPVIIWLIPKPRSETHSPYLRGF